MAIVDARLQQAVTVWRTELGHARSGEHPELSESDVAGREVSVVVTYAGDIEPLRAAGLETGFDREGVVSGRLALRDVDRLASVPGVQSIALEPPVHIALDKTVSELRVPWKVPPADPWPGKGAGVIVAVIDTGIDIFHDSFRKSDGTTRILELWDQAATTGGNSPPAAFQQVGRVYSAQNINDGIAAGPPFASSDTNGHGTHVAGIAAGNGRQDDRCSFPGRFVGVAPEADLVIVRAIDLPPGSPPPAIRDAMQWCAQAGVRHGNKPVVMNCSFGTSLGPHDGTGTLDGFVDQIVRPAAGPPQGIAIVCAAGNEGDSEIHESGAVAANGTTTVSFYVPEGSVNPDMLEIWYTGTATLALTLTAPPNPAIAGPNTVGPIGPGAPGSPFALGRMTIAVISSTAPQAANNKKMINVTISTPPATSVRPGVWQLRLTETGGVAATWDAWFATSHGDAYPTFRLPTDGDPPARRRENTIGEPGTSRNAITVASYSDDDGELAASSSRGLPAVPPGTPVGEFKPTVAAPGVGVAAARSSGDPDTPSSCCDQKVIDKSGTSMAAPHVAGVVALMLHKNRTLTFEQARGHLQHATRIDGIPASEVPPVFDAILNIRAGHLWGSGKVSAAQTLAEMPALPGGGGGGGGGMMLMADLHEREWGYTPHTIFSRLGDWQNRYGPRPGLMLAASLVSEHVDEVLWLVNNNRRVGAVWRRQGGHLLVRHLLHGPTTEDAVLPATVGGCDVQALLQRLLPLLDRFGGPRLRHDIVRFGAFVRTCPDADLQRLDDEALSLTAGS